jgi:hypothetical protein
MDPRVSATAVGLLRPRMTKGRGFSLNRHDSKLAGFSYDFVILGRSRSEANCADPRIHAVTLTKLATVQT